MTPDSTPTILIVDDSPVDGRKAEAIVEQSLGWHVIRANGGKEAIEIVAREKPAVVLTDLQMPDLDGLGLVEQLHLTDPLLPVVLMTAHGSEEIAVEALKSGAASYVPKRNLALVLAETLSQVITAAAADRDRKVLAEECLIETASTYVLPNEPGLLRAMVARLVSDMTFMGLCSDARRVRAGIALEEALTNALYHGNLEVSSTLRDGPDPDAYHRLATERRRQLPYKDRKITVRTALTRMDGIVRIEDEGPGFVPSSLPDPTDPENMGRACGRGLLLIRTFADEVTHNVTGNEIALRFSREVAGSN